MNNVMNTYSRAAVEFSHGNGAHLYDTEGKEYLDGLAGIAVCGLGHAHPAVSRAISEQASKLLHCSNLFPIALQEQLADRLCANAGMDTAFFSNSGAEANEAAIKIARLWGHNHNIENPSIIVMDGAFHGRTMATLSASGNRKIQAGFEPLLSGFVRAPYNDVDAVESIGKHNPSVVAVMLEPVQGEAGVIVPNSNYLAQLRQLCDKHNWLLILDEVQTGMGRSGDWFAYQQHNIKPDVVTSAKSLGNGMPIGACMAAGDAATVLQPGNHGSTFGGNPVACAAALAVINTLEDQQLLDNARQRGEQIRNGLTTSIGALDNVKSIRGIGLMIGIELTSDCTALVKQALDAGLVLNVTAGNTLRLLPPLIITSDQADTIIATVTTLIKNHGAQRDQ